MASSGVSASSWPASAFVVGVNIGSGSRSASRNPAGAATPLIVPCSRYSCHAWPKR
jgi:hypothetical protein